ncbi:MAG: hypothetical protein ACKVHB_06990 [Pseudomonadales bacterium]|jgi:hypothetical protein
MTTFLIVAVTLYIGLALHVANTARKNNRNPHKWFFTALGINPLLAQLLLFSRITGTTQNELPTNTFNWFGKKLSSETVS